MRLAQLGRTLAGPVAAAVALVSLSLLLSPASAAYTTSANNAGNVFSASTLYAGTPQLTEDFSTGTVWNSSKWTNLSNTASSAGTNSIVSGAGRMSFSQVNSAVRFTSITSPTTFTDQGVYFRHRFSSASSADLTARVGVRSDGAANTNNCTNCYWFELESGQSSGGANFVVQKSGSGNGTNIALATNNTSWWQYRFEVVGQTLRMKRWTDGTAEPTAWTTTWAVPAANQVTSGKMWIETIEYNSSTSLWDEFDDITYYSIP